MDFLNPLRQPDGVRFRMDYRRRIHEDENGTETHLIFYPLPDGTEQDVGKVVDEPDARKVALDAEGTELGSFLLIDNAIIEVIKYDQAKHQKES